MLQKYEGSKPLLIGVPYPVVYEIPAAPKIDRASLAAEYYDEPEVNEEEYVEYFEPTPNTLKERLQVQPQRRRPIAKVNQIIFRQ